MTEGQDGRQPGSQTEPKNLNEASPRHARFVQFIKALLKIRPPLSGVESSDKTNLGLHREPHPTSWYQYGQSR